MTETFKIDGMHCAGCVKNIEDLFSLLPGVGRVVVSLEDGTVKIESTQEYRVDELQTVLDENSAPYYIDEL